MTNVIYPCAYIGLCVGWLLVFILLHLLSRSWNWVRSKKSRTVNHQTENGEKTENLRHDEKWSFLPSTYRCMQNVDNGPRDSRTHANKNEKEDETSDEWYVKQPKSLLLHWWYVRIGGDWLYSSHYYFVSLLLLLFVVRLLLFFFFVIVGDDDW